MPVRCPSRCTCPKRAASVAAVVDDGTGAAAGLRRPGPRASRSKPTRWSSPVSCTGRHRQRELSAGQARSRSLTARFRVQPAVTPRARSARPQQPGRRSPSAHRPAHPPGPQPGPTPPGVREAVAANAISSSLDRCTFTFELATVWSPVSSQTAVHLSPHQLPPARTTCGFGSDSVSTSSDLRLPERGSSFKPADPRRRTGKAPLPTVAEVTPHSAATDAFDAPSNTPGRSARRSASLGTPPQRAQRETRSAHHRRGRPRQHKDLVAT